MTYKIEPSQKMDEAYDQPTAFGGGLTGVLQIAGKQITGDLEQLIADTENKLDDEVEGYYAPDLLEDLLIRLRMIAGLDTEGYAVVRPIMDAMTIGSPDRCMIRTPHTAGLCGKTEAHR